MKSIIFHVLTYLCNSDNSEQGWRGEVFCNDVGKEEAEEGEADDDKVKDAPAIGEVAMAQSKHLHEHLRCENHDEPEKSLV